MPTPSVDDILSTLPQLSLRDVQNIADACRAAAQLGGGVSQERDLITSANGVTSSPSEEWLLDGVASYMRKAGFGFTAPRMLKSMLNRERVPGLLEFFMAEHLTRIQRHALLMLGLEMLHDHVASWTIPVGVAMMKNLHVIPQLFERQFPAYARMGMLHVIVRDRSNDHART